MSGQWICSYPRGKTNKVSWNQSEDEWRALEPERGSKDKIEINCIIESNKPTVYNVTFSSDSSHNIIALW